MKKRIKNESGFSLIELLIVIAIMGVLAVIAFTSFGGVLSSSKKKSDMKSAKIIEDAITIMIVETGITNFTGATTGLKHDKNGTKTAWDIVDADINGEVEKLVTYLQLPLYCDTDGDGVDEVYGPYLKNTNIQKAKATYTPYQPQWNDAAGGKYDGYRVIVNAVTGDVNVKPVDTTSPSTDLAGVDIN